MSSVLFGPIAFGLAALVVWLGSVYLTLFISDDILDEVYERLGGDVWASAKFLVAVELKVLIVTALVTALVLSVLFILRVEIPTSVLGAMLIGAVLALSLGVARAFILGDAKMRMGRPYEESTSSFSTEDW